MPSPIEMMIDKATGYEPPENSIPIASCPHCGGKATISSQICEFEKPRDETIYFAEVTCTNFLLCGARVTVFLNNEAAARSHAIGQWNRRTYGR